MVPGIDSNLVCISYHSLDISHELQTREPSLSTVPLCFLLIRGLHQIQPDFYASLHAQPEDQGGQSVPPLAFRVDCYAIVDGRGGADAMITCRKPSLERAKL